MNKTVSTLLILAVFAATAVQAQDMPAPRRMPRTPVSREVLVEPRDPMPASHQLQGPAAIIDGEKLRIGESDLRLFGIVPPQLSASFGPQARAALDSLANGQPVTCQIRDRDRDGRLLATCRNAKDVDMAQELLKHGLAVTARGSIAGTELASPYLAAEQLAQSEKIGLWNVTAVAQQAAAVAPPPVKPESKQESVAVPAEVETKKDDKIAPRTDKAISSDAQMQAKITADLTAQQIQAHYDDTAWTPAESTGFFERYQILIAGILMLTTALSIIAALWAQKRRDRLDEMKATAAALRGELMAARGVCIGRAKSINNEEEDRAATWPRIRATLYQAYVGRLGILGAELARQVASIYGQSGDYAALYQPAGAAIDAPKKQALEILAKRIDEVLPKLAEIEKTGQLPVAIAPRAYMLASAPSLRATPRPVTPPLANNDIVAPAVTIEETGPTEIEPAYAAPPQAALRSPVALWENVRSFLQSNRNAVARELPEHPIDPHSEYAAMIEADMARYQYSETVDSLDLSPQKKRG